YFENCQINRTKHEYAPKHRRKACCYLERNHWHFGRLCIHLDVCSTNSSSVQSLSETPAAMARTKKEPDHVYRRFRHSRARRQDGGLSHMGKDQRGFLQ